MNKLIAIIDDEPDILELVSLHLTKSGFKVKKFLNGENFFKFLSKEIPDLIILDLMLPDSDGIEICKYLKSNENFNSIPIIMLTALSSEVDRILGLEIGADDYVTKPFSPRELVARVKAVLRRRNEKQLSSQIKIGDILLIDFNKYKVYVENKEINLTSTEFRILKILAQKRGWVFTRDQILYHLWGHDKAVLDRTVDVHIKSLREKLGKAGEFIKSVRGVGYKIEE